MERPDAGQLDEWFGKKRSGKNNRRRLLLIAVIISLLLNLAVFLLLQNRTGAVSDSGGNASGAAFSADNGKIFSKK